MSEEEALKSMGMELFISDGVLHTAPENKKSGSENLYLFTVGYPVKDQDLAGEYAKLHLEPADIYAFAALNKADPYLAYSFPNGISLQDEEYRSYYAHCAPFFGVVDVNVRLACEHDYEWPRGTWFIGIEKK